MRHIKVLGCGTYGCAVKPVIELEDANVDMKYIYKKETDISKIFVMDDIDTLKAYKEELEELKLINEIDNGHIFTVPLKGAYIGYITEHIYSPSSLIKLYKSIYYYERDKDKIRKKEFNPQKDNRDDEKKIHQIILGDGGSELNDSVVFVNTKNKYKNFIKLFNNFLQGMMLLNNAKKIHRDIKPPNVLFDGKKINLIDFGLSTNVENLYVFNNDNIDMMNYKYEYYPPEYYLCGIIYSNIVDKIKADINNENLKVSKFKIKTLINDVNINNRYEKLICDEQNSKFIIDILEKFKNNTTMHDIYINELNNKKISNNPEFLKLYKEFFTIQINKFIDHIINRLKLSKNENIKEILKTKIYNEEIIQKFDVYSLAYIILPFYKYLSGLKGADELSIKQKAFLSYIFNNCVNTNPIDRISLIDLKKLIETEMKENITESLSSSSLSSLSSLSSSLSSFTFSSSSKSSLKGGRDVSIINKKQVTLDIPVKKIIQTSLKKKDISAYYTNKINFMDYINFDYRKAKSFKKL